MIARRALSVKTQVLGREAVLLELLGHDVALGDLDLLVLGVAGEADHSMRSRKAAWMVSVRFAVQMNITFERSKGTPR